MRTCKVTIESISPYSQSQMHDAPKLDRESHEDYETRTWLEKCTTDDKGNVCIPGMAFKQAIDTAAYKLGMKVDGRRGATFKGFFASGFMCNGDVPIGIHKDKAVKVTINANADGVRGSGKRVKRSFPVFPKWNGIAEFTIVDDIITPDVFEAHVKAAGAIVGIGRFRAEKGGTNGRFKPTKFEWNMLEF